MTESLAGHRPGRGRPGRSFGTLHPPHFEYVVTARVDAWKERVRGVAWDKRARVVAWTKQARGSSASRAVPDRAAKALVEQRSRGLPFGGAPVRGGAGLHNVGGDHHLPGSAHDP